MLMECLAAGRSISLPSSSAAGAKSLLRNTSAYARIRKQFDLPIGKMEGLEEPLARMVENAYVNEAARGVTASMVSRGEKPSVHLGDHEIPDDRAHAPLAQRRHGPARRPRHLRRADQLSDGGLPGDAGRHHGRGRQHPHALAHHLRAGRAALAPLSLQGDPGLPGRRRGARARGLRQGVLRPRRLLAVEHVRRLLPQHHLRPLRHCAGEGLRHGGMVSPAVARLAQLRLRRRPDGGRARRRPQDQAEAHRPPRRCAVRALPAVLRAQALRGRRQAGQRPPYRGAAPRRTASSASRRRCAAPSTTSPSRRCAG